VVRGIHYWSASAMVVMVGLHALRVFYMAAFKYPREATWIVGVLLLFATLALGFTGFLLRWDQDAYWGTVVLASMSGKVPLIGPFLVQLIQGGPEIDGVTLSRFFGLHTIVLPATVAAAIGLHLYLVIRLGISTPPKRGEAVVPSEYEAKYTKEKERGKPFFPDAVYKDAIMGFGVFVIVLALAIVVGPPALSAQADPASTVAVPRPEWFFIWFFGLLTLVPAQVENPVIILFPFIALFGLLALPLVSPTGQRHPLSRPIASLAAFAVVVLLVGLAYRGFTFSAPGPTVGPPPAAGLTVSQQAGLTVFSQSGCGTCHIVNGVGGKIGPDLSHVSSQLTRDQISQFITNPPAGSGMPSFNGRLTADQLQSLLDYLQTLK
jgi:ubiquinol-cytochrome c reductase cytochrome b subunit